jgi:hypothetical protein
MRNQKVVADAVSATTRSAMPKGVVKPKEPNKQFAVNRGKEALAKLFKVKRMK